MKVFYMCMCLVRRFNTYSFDCCRSESVELQMSKTKHTDCEVTSETLVSVNETIKSVVFH